MSAFTVTLPYPISANAYWSHKVVRSRETGRPIVLTFVTHEARAYKADVAKMLRVAGVRRPIEGRVRIHLDLYPKRPADWQTRQRKLGAAWDDTVQSLDVDNARKVLYDAMKGIVFGDDKWVWSDSAQRCEPDGDARVVVTIAPLQIEQPQVGLDFGAAL